MGFLDTLKKIGKAADTITNNPAVQAAIPALPQIKAAENAIKGASIDPASAAAAILVEAAHENASKIKPVALYVHNALKVIYASDPDFQ